MATSPNDFADRAPSSASDEMAKQRNSIPPKDRCIVGDGFGMIADHFLQTYRTCRGCNGTGRNPRSNDGGSR